jgi:hypothetical protein
MARGMGSSLVEALEALQALAARIGAEKRQQEEDS